MSVNTVYWCEVKLGSAKIGTYGTMAEAQAAATANGPGSYTIASVVQVETSTNSTFVVGGKTAATPTFSPPSGPISPTQKITLNCATPGALMYYTLDGSTPTCPPSGTTREYTAPFAL